MDTDISIGTYYYRLKQMDIDGTFQYSQVIEVVVNAPLMFKLEQNYPNPFLIGLPARSQDENQIGIGGQAFNLGTNIRYHLAKAGRVSIKIFNLMGQEIKTVEDGYKQTGYFTVFWNGKDNEGQYVSAGVYIYTIQTGEFVDSRKMLLIR